MSGDLVVRYEPVVDLASGRLAGLTAASQWRRWWRWAWPLMAVR